MANVLHEVRDYTIDPAWFEAYQTWARDHAAPWLSANLDMVGFWMQPPAVRAVAAEVSGSNPVVSPNGQPNVTWILRWKDKPTRDAQFAEVFGSDGWKEVWARHPNPNSYLHMNARFLELVE